MSCVPARKSESPTRVVAEFRPEPVSNRPLRIGVDEQRLRSTSRERGGEIDRRRGLADSTFLADDGEDLSHVQGSDPSAERFAAQLLQSFFGVPDPAIRFGAGGWLGEKRVEVFFRAGAIAALQKEKREPVVRAGEFRIDSSSARSITSESLLPVDSCA